MRVRIPSCDRMAHHKRKKPKHLRAGCLLCKPWKDEREPKRKRFRPGEQRKLQEPARDNEDDAFNRRCGIQE